MNLHDFITIIESPQPIKKYVKKKNLKSIKTLLRKYKYVDVHEYTYDDPENSNLNTWIDIEGIGYGWLWIENKNSKRKQRARLIKYASDLFRTCCDNNIYYMFTDSENQINLIFQNDDCIVWITLSNSPLFP